MLPATAEKATLCAKRDKRKLHFFAPLGRGEILKHETRNFRRSYREEIQAKTTEINLFNHCKVKGRGPTTG